jgi:uncharacterized protein with HEPN domain
MNETDRIRLRHMVDAAREALSFIEGKNRDDLTGDRMLALSLIKEIEIIGEAATKISSELKHSISSIPWAEIVGMRNRLIHGYADINLDILWDTVNLALGPLTVELESC